MTDEATKFPGRFHRHRQLSPKEMYAVPEPPDELVWELCPYLRLHRQDDWRCRQCPRWVHDERHGKLCLGCYGMAQEAVRVVLGMQAKLAGEPPRGDDDEVE